MTLDFFAKYLQETIIGAISVPDTDFDKLLGRFPINKDEKILIFAFDGCFAGGGLHFSAAAARY